MITPIQSARGFVEDHALACRQGFWAAFVALALAMTFAAGCGDDDGDDSDNADRTPKPVAGTFVGKVPDSKAFVSVVAAPPAKGEDRRAATVYVCDARRLCELLPGTATGNDFSAEAEAGDTTAEGKLSSKQATGSIEMDGETLRFEAARATAAAGVYDLTVSASGRIRGASAAGVALTGTSTLPEPGTGTLRLADGSRLKFRTTKASDGAGAPEAGQVRLIVLPGGQLRGIGKTKQTEGDDQLVFYMRSLRG